MSISEKEFQKQFSSVGFKALSRKEKNPRVRERLLVLFHICEGLSFEEASLALGKNKKWCSLWVRRYVNEGYEGLFDRPRSGQPTFLTKKQEQDLVIDLIQLQDKRNGGRMIGTEIIAFIEKKYKVTYSSSGCYDLLARLGLSWVSVRSKHPKADPAKQEEFKNNFKTRIQEVAIKKKRKSSK